MLTFTCFSVGFLIGSATMLRRGLAEILAFVTAPIVLVILIRLTVTSFEEGSTNEVSLQAAGEFLLCGIVAGLILTGLPSLLSMGSKAPSKTERSYLRWLSFLSSLRWFTDLNLRISKRSDTAALYYRTAVKLGALISMMDGKTERREFSALCTAFNIRKSTCPDADALYQQQIQSPESLKEIVRPFLRAFGAKSSNGETLIFGMAKIALADGHADPNEIELIWQTATALRIPITDTMRILTTAGIRGNNQDANTGFRWDANAHKETKAQPLTEREKHLATLGLEANASAQNIRKAWRKLAAKYHPDKLAGRHLPPDELKKAEEMMKKVNAAYDWLTP